jgi:hypothetical protein
MTKLTPITLFTVLSALFSLPAAYAQPAQAASAAVPTSGRVFLSKSELEASVSGHKWVFVVPAGPRTVRWDFRSDGVVFMVNHSTGMGSGSGTWIINDDAQVCVKFPLSSNGIDSCQMVAKTDGGLRMVNAMMPRSPGLQLTID